MRHDAQTFMEHLPSQETIIRVEKENNMFVVKYGLFKQEHEAKKFMIEHNISCYEFNITKGTIDSSNFLLANQYYKYDYHIPYKNREFINGNSTFKVFMKQHLLKKNFGVNESKHKKELKKNQKTELKKNQKIKQIKKLKLQIKQKEFMKKFYTLSKIFKRKRKKPHGDFKKNSLLND